MAKSTEQFVSVDGHRIRLTNLEKVLYPETGTTKGDVIDYYARVADVLLPHARDRPATRKRWVHGVGTAEEPGQMFFQKNLDDATPTWVKHRTIHHSDHDNEYPLVNDVATLTWLGQIAALEIHVPQWRFGRGGAKRNPDRLVLDLDPGPGTGLAECAEVARLSRSVLRDMGLDPMPVTSGSKGIHLYATLDGSQDDATVSAVAHELARALEADHPDLIVSDMKKSLRDGKVLVDWSQNNGNKTTITPYSLRGRARPMVAAPRTWRELASKDLAHLDYTEVLRRVSRRGDVLAPLLEAEGGTVELPDDGNDDSDGTSDEEPDRLQRYRSMRDAAKTPEPVPRERVVAGSSDATRAPTFVIQEHHARALHWDFRLEHDGVLVSWALPKGVPTETGKNHLAVQTEDHPIEYGGFAGDIPKGEYGAGTVEIWDSGTYELEKWRDGKEVIATLHGEKHGTHRYALIHTGGSERAASNWLIHLMKDQPDEGSPPVVPARGKKRATARRRALPDPMLATLGSEATVTSEPDEDWAFEMKWDGIRAIAEVSDASGTGSVRLLSRNGHDMTASYPELLDLLRAVTDEVVLDGEIVALNAAGRPDFGLLQTRMKLTKEADVARGRRETPVHFMVFDILDKNGTSLVKKPWDERRALLEETVRTTGAVQVPPVFDGDLGDAIEASTTLGLEGVMAKRRDATYTAGRRSSAWVKIKHNRTQEVVVAGWRPGAGSRSGRIGSLLLGVPDGADLRYVGRVGSGFSERELDDLLVRLRRRTRKSSPLVAVPAADARDANWVRADLVGEVEFAEWTSTGRLRQPRWRGWRPDKNVDDLTVET